MSRCLKRGEFPDLSSILKFQEVFFVFPHAPSRCCGFVYSGLIRQEHLWIGRRVVEQEQGRLV